MEIKLPYYNNGDNDQPITCPVCGSRVEITEDLFDEYKCQKCRCLNPECLYEFVMDFEKED